MPWTLSAKSFEASPAAKQLDDDFALAYKLMSSGEARSAFALDQEPAAMRDRYGRTRFGQSCLLARRLIEAGVRFVTVNMFETVFGEITWDIHGSAPFTDIKQMARPGRAELRPGLFGAAVRFGRARPFGNDGGDRRRRIRPDAEDQPGRRPRPSSRLLDNADRRRPDQGRPGDRRIGCLGICPEDAAR